jgi:hypothetical protein
MPDRRKHRGPHPADTLLFDEAAQPALREAVTHVSWLLTKEYAPLSTLKLVGDRFRLTERQRTAVIRSACSDQALQVRSASERLPTHVDGESLWIDGFNLLTTIEAALAGGVILRGRDGCYRDMASMHGNYRRVDETRPALSLISEVLEQFNATSCRWYLDRPVSNSGRLSGIVREVGDRILAESSDVVVTADSWILDRCPRWFNLAAHIVRSRIPTANVIQMSGAV